MNIVTDRLIIRNFNILDADDLHEILGDSETMKYCEPAYDFEQTQRFLSDFCIDKNGAVAVAEKESGKVIGYVLFKELETSVFEIGWIFNKRFWRRGYAYEACSNIISYASDKMCATKIVAETIDTQKSVGLMEKLGMKREKVQKNATEDDCGNLADMYFYEIICGVK